MNFARTEVKSAAGGVVIIQRGRTVAIAIGAAYAIEAAGGGALVGRACRIGKAAGLDRVDIDIVGVKTGAQTEKPLRLVSPRNL